MLACRPDPQLGKYRRSDESPRQTLIREALEYQELYCRDKGISSERKEARVKEILAEIEATGSYTHTYDELQHGARCAWR
jgi:nitric-oxide synthase